MPGAKRGQQFGVSFAPAPEDEIVADDHMARLEPGDDDVVNELLGRRGGDGFVEMDKPQRLDPEQF